MALTESEKKQDKKEKPLTKVIIRRLPPTMTKEQFINQVSPLPDYNYMYHVRGDLSLGENAFSRAYINFVCPEDVYGFKEKFDNYVFVDNKGHEYTAVVEFAPFQKIPKKRGKARMDPKCKTIDSDTYFLEFVANLNKPVEQDAKPEYTLQLGDRSDEKKKDITTPLLEFIKNKRAQKLKIREVRREERERRKKEFERRKEHGKYEGKYYDEKKYDEKSPSKVYGKKPHIKSPKNEALKEPVKMEKSDDKLGAKEKREDKPHQKHSPETKPKEKKFEEKKEKKEIKPRFPKKEYSDGRDFNKRDDYSYRDYRQKHYEEYKKEDSKTFPKKIKKYSEKREERKIEAQKAEQKKLEQQAKEKETPTQSEVNCEKDNTKTNSSATNERETEPPKPKENDEKTTTSETPQLTKQLSSDKEIESEEKRKDSDEKSDTGSSSSRRIRNKDRPTIPLYRPGMLSKRKQTDEDIPKVEAKAVPKKE